MLGGGTFITQNKILSGAYINFVSASKASATISDRGVCAMPLELDWGVDGEVFEVTADVLQKQSLAYFGYSYDKEELRPLREIFKNAKTLYAYRLNSGVKASCTYGTAKYSGVRGNALAVKIATNVDDEAKFDVSTILDGEVLETQTVASAIELVDNAFIVFKKDATLQATASTPLTGGTNGTVTGTQHQAFLNAIESYSFNILGVATDDASINALYASFTKRMRDDVGVKFQTVLYRTEADYEGIISVENCVDAIYWVVGAECGCAVNKSCLNKKYDGEYVIPCEHTQAQLEKLIKGGKFAFHKVGTEIRVLADINTLVSTSDTKGDDFKENQTMRVLDNLGNDIATLFNTKYLGVVPNDADGRVSLWNDIVKIFEQLQTIRAIEDFTNQDVTVEKGDTKKSVIANIKVTPVNVMGQLYMTINVM